MLPQMKNLEYEERLRKLKLPTLKYRCMRGDMIETFKIITGICDKRVTKDIFHLSKSTLRDRPFNLQGGEVVVMFFFRSEFFFSDNTRVFFFVAQSAKFFSRI